MFRFIVLTLSGAILLFANAAFAGPQEDRLREIMPEIQSTIMQQGLVETLRSYNESRSNMTQAEIDGLEAIWKTELDSGNRPLITGVVRNVTALRMRKVIRDTGRVINAINVVDAKGLSIAQTSVFPCIWQGAEGKTTNFAEANSNTVLISSVESAVSDRSSQMEAFFPVTDPDTNELIGAVILVVDVATL